MTVRTRFAPSPTGDVHIGSIRTALYCYLWAQHNHWKFILRIEDTDQLRLVEGSVDGVIDILERMSLISDEWPHKHGEYGPYTQSERLDIYTPRLHALCEAGTAYYCFCTSDRLDTLRNEQESLKLPPGYDGHCRHIPLEEAKERIANGEKYTIRLKVPKGEKIIFNDLIRGRIEFNTSEVDDCVLMKSDGIPTYHGAVVIDDDAMKITHVMRWEEWISSIPKQVLTARALGITLPEYAHMPNILWPDGKKLSKRTGDTSAELYLQKWYLPEALLNFVALLGWHPKQDEEILSMDEMIAKFEIRDIHKSWAVLDPVKLDWMNGEYIKRLSLEELHTRLANYLEKYAPDFYHSIFSQAEYVFNTRILRELQTRMKRFDEYIELTKFLYADCGVRTDLLINPKMKIESLSDARESLMLGRSVIESFEHLDDMEAIKSVMILRIQEAGKKNGQVLWPIRVALSGEEFSPGAFELAHILGKDESLRRIDRVLESL